MPDGRLVIEAAFEPTEEMFEECAEDEGIYGHFGAYQREMKALEVIEIRRATPQEIIQRKKLEKSVLDQFT